jgi:hypothetical protein
VCTKWPPILTFLGAPINRGNSSLRDFSRSFRYFVFITTFLTKNLRFIICTFTFQKIVHASVILHVRLIIISVIGYNYPTVHVWTAKFLVMLLPGIRITLVYQLCTLFSEHFPFFAFEISLLYSNLCITHEWYLKMHHFCTLFLYFNLSVCLRYN